MTSRHRRRLTCAAPCLKPCAKSGRQPDGETQEAAFQSREGQCHTASTTQPLASGFLAFIGRGRTVLLLVLGVGAVIVVVANDWWKRRLVDKSRRQGEPARKEWLANKTNWGLTIALVVFLSLYAIVLNDPGLVSELRNRDFGPLDSIIQWFLEQHPNAG